jgi:two-component system CheB/CheR fusion protein
MSLWHDRSANWQRCALPLASGTSNELGTLAGAATGIDGDSDELAAAETALLGANRLQAAAALKVATLRHALGERRALPVVAPASSVDFDVCERPLVYIVDHDAQVRAALRRILEANSFRAKAFVDGATFLASHHCRANACLVADTAIADLGGLSLLLKLGAAADPLPVVMITDSRDIGLAVRAMQAGAVDFIEKPIDAAKLVASVLLALSTGQLASDRVANRNEALHHFEALTPRQRQIMVLVLAGHPSKNIAADLGISQRTVENHRAAIMRKSGSKSLPALARLALAAEGAKPN